MALKLAVLPICIVAVTTAASVAYAALWSSNPSIPKNESVFDTASLRQGLPRSLADWAPKKTDEKRDYALWKSLEGFFQARGYKLWRPTGLTCLGPPPDMIVRCNGFALAPLHRGWGEGSRVTNLFDFQVFTALNRPARASDGRDVVIRVICSGSEGQNQLEVLKEISEGLRSQVTPNHAIPLFEFIELEDIIFGVFPRVGSSMSEAYNSWAENSVGDIVDMIMQCLEALSYLHSIGVAHRDAFKDNFLVQWQPESLGPRQLTISRPRIFLNDFETAVYFRRDIPSEERTCVGLPLSPSFPYPDRYFRSVPYEVKSGKPYNPFKLDDWQFGTSLKNLKTTIPKIDEVLISLREEDPLRRTSSYDALVQIARVVHSMTPESLKIPPVVIEN